MLGRLACSIAVAAVACGQAPAQCSADKLAYPGSQDSSAWFGAAVTLWGGTGVVSAISHVENGVATGSAYVFHRVDALSWGLEQQLLASDGAEGDRFGGAAVWEDLIVVGASGADAPATDSGAAYVFRRDGGVWVEEQKLAAADGAAADGFGSVAARGDLIVVGASTADPDGSNSGAAYVFEYDGSVWTQTHKLRPSGAGQDMYFGRGVAVDAGRILVSAIGFDGFAGAVFVFERDGNGWSQTQVLLSPEHAPGGVFGSAIAFDGSRVLVGAAGESSDGAEQVGAAYLFADQGGGQWLLEAKLAPSGRGELDNYGAFVALAGEAALVGQNPHDLTEAAPPTLFVRGNSGWAQSAEISSLFESPDAIYGGSVALSEEAALVGSRPDYDFGTLPGAAFAFNFSACVCVADSTGDGVVDTRDVLAYLRAWAAGHAGADIVHDGQVNIQDFLAFLNFWVAGC